MREMKNYRDVNAYIKDQPKEVQARLRKVRETIRKAVPRAEEGISYGLPAYKFNGVLAYFGAFKEHLGFYAAPTTNVAFKKDLAAYKVGRGSVQFLYNKPLPVGLISRMVKWRAKENLEKAKLKAKKKIA